MYKKNHNQIHKYQKKNYSPFHNAKEIDIYLNQLENERIRNNSFIDKTLDVDNVDNIVYHPLDKVGKRELEKNIEIYKQLEKERKEELKETTLMIVSLIGISLIIFILFVLYGINTNNTQEQISIEPPLLNQTELIPIKIEPLIVESSNIAIIIRNNQQKNISLEIDYKLYSKWYGTDRIESKIFNVNANTGKTFNVFDNEGCNVGIGDCSVIIINYTEIVQ